MLARLGDAECVAHLVEERNLRERHALLAVPGGDVKHRLVRARRDGLVDLEQPVRVRDAGDDQATLGSVQLDLHSGGDNASRNVNDVNGDSGHLLLKRSRELRAYWSPALP